MLLFAAAASAAADINSAAAAGGAIYLYVEFRVFLYVCCANLPLFFAAPAVVFRRRRCAAD